MNSLDDLILQKPNCDYFKQLLKLSKRDDTANFRRYKAGVNNLQVYLPKSNETLMDKFQCLLDWDYEFINRLEIPNLSADNVANNLKFFKDLVRLFIENVAKFTYLKPAVCSFIRYVEKKHGNYYTRLHKRLNRTGYDNHDTFATSYFNCMCIICKNFKLVKAVMLDE